MVDQPDLQKLQHFQRDRFFVFVAFAQVDDLQDESIVLGFVFLDLGVAPCLQQRFFAGEVALRVVDQLFERGADGDAARSFVKNGVVQRVGDGDQLTVLFVNFGDAEFKRGAPRHEGHEVLSTEKCRHRKWTECHWPQGSTSEFIDR